MIILGIETSCDETAISIVRATGTLDAPEFQILGSALHSQIETHREFGGVVPMLAKREHAKNLPLVLEKALSQAKVNNSLDEFNPSKIDLIAVTVGPGLEPALWAGIKFAEELGSKWNIPIIATNHMMGHIVSVLFDSKNKIHFPAISLLISGGHTELVYLKSWFDINKIGETQDDAVGEAFDKVARMLGLPYPGGPEISRLAEEARAKNLALETKFPRPMLHSKDYNFSFSGLKTAVLYFVRDNTSPQLRKLGLPLPLSRGGERGEVIPLLLKQKISREFEDAVTETLVSKTKSALAEYDPKTLIIAGGVIANAHLQRSFLELHKIYSDLKILIPEKSLTTDNATMIAAAGYIEFLKGGNEVKLEAQGKLPIN